MESADEAVIVFVYRGEQVKIPMFTPLSWGSTLTLLLLFGLGMGLRYRIDHPHFFTKPACGGGKLTLARIASTLSPPSLPTMYTLRRFTCPGP